ncbi:MAG: nucleotide exchange factor GrpE [Bacteroidaceae bacterium]|nr:nucleotide exchange factor GrpE [Bacteroidaceae bacterium]
MSEKDKEILEDAVNENIGTNDENVQESTEQENAGEENVEPENTELTNEERVQKELDEANEKIAMLEDRYLRQIAEFDNYRKRTMKEKAELIKNGGERTIEAILPVLDDFERALNNMAKDENAAEAMKGVELIYNKFIGILKQNGLQKIETEGADFDTDYHEAIAMVPAFEESQKGKVLDCIQSGYMLNEKVIRHAKVAVGE